MSAAVYFQRLILASVWRLTVIGGKKKCQKMILEDALIMQERVDGGLDCGSSREAVRRGQIWDLL